MSKPLDIEYCFLEKHQCLMVSIKGKVFLSHLAETIPEVYASDWFEPDMHEIWNFGEATIHFSEAELQELSQLEMRVRPAGNNVKSALVCIDEASREVVVRYGEMLKIANVEFRMFRSLEQAKTWILAD